MNIRHFLDETVPDYLDVLLWVENRTQYF